MAAAKAKAVYGKWADIKIGDVNRLLKPFGARLVAKRSKEWAGNMVITAHPVGSARVRAPKPAAPAAPVVADLAAGGDPAAGVTP